MKLKALRQSHSECQEALFCRYEALTFGGEAFRRRVNQFLPRNHLDTDRIYMERCATARYTPHIGTVVDGYASQLFDAPFDVRGSIDGVQAELDPFYASFKEDCDGMGTDLVTFMKDRFVQALIKRSSYWIAELPRLESAPETLADWKLSGAGDVKLCPIDAECLKDWELKDDGTYAWIKTHEVRTRRPRPDMEVVCEETWRIYDDENVYVYRLAYNPKKKPSPETVVPLVDEYAHGFTRIPIVAMQLPRVMWILDRAADTQIEHFCLSAYMSWIMRTASSPVPVMKLADAESTPKFQAGMGLTLGINEEFKWEETPGSNASVLSSEIKAKKDEIFRVSQQMAMSIDNSAAALGRSGDSKAADRVATEICLRGYAQHVREALERTYDLIREARGDQDVVFSIEGMTAFAQDDAATVIKNANDAVSIGIPSVTLHREIAVRVAEVLLPRGVSQDTKDKVRAEIMASDQPLKTSASSDAQNNGEGRTNGGNRTDSSPPQGLDTEEDNGN